MKEKAAKKRRSPSATITENVPNISLAKPNEKAQPYASLGSSHFKYSQFQYNETLLKAIEPHINSFNAFLEVYISEIVKELPVVYIDPVYTPERHELDIFYDPGEFLKIGVSEITIGYPTRDASHTFDNRLFPKHCRNAHISYSAPIWVTFTRENTSEDFVIKKKMQVGRLPIMVKSKHCHLEGLSPEEMVMEGEDVDECGGYFIVNGIERIIRFVIQPRCNYPMAVKNPAFKSRDVFSTEHAVYLRSQRYDGTSTANILYHTINGRCIFRILLNRQEWLCPFWLLLRSLVPNLSVDALRLKFLEGSWTIPQQCVLYNVLFEDFQCAEPAFSDVDILENRYLHQLGKVFWRGLLDVMKPGSRYEDAGRFIIKKYVLVHIDNWSDKFECLLLMYKKLISLTEGLISPEKLDAISCQEVILPGQLMSAVLKDNILKCLLKIRQQFLMQIRMLKGTNETPCEIIRNTKYFDTITDRCGMEIGLKLNYFLATGNIQTQHMDVQQLSGWTLVADRLNMNRFISHFRAVHRGQFFTRMKTTNVRKLFGESWGFLCPVHTPDGISCGLLLHLAQDAIPVTDCPDRSMLLRLKLYMEAHGCTVDVSGHSGRTTSESLEVFPLVVDGIPICTLPYNKFNHWLEHIRNLKMQSLEGLKPHMELAGFDKNSGQFGGIYIFSFPGRLVRPVIHLQSNSIEWIGPLVQPWCSIAVNKQEIVQSQELLVKQSAILDNIAKMQNHGAPLPMSSLEMYSRFLAKEAKEPKEKKVFYLSQKTKEMHNYMLPQNAPLKHDFLEINATSILSINAALTPFSNYNQSPRNMYQCQMLKQTMGTPFHNIPYRADNKAYRLITPQRPIVYTNDYAKFNFDNYPTGVNAIVAVIAYTGFDMEDAMIINKSSVERGAFHGCVYKTKVIETKRSNKLSTEVDLTYNFNNTNEEGDLIVKELEADGLPAIGTKLQKGSPLCRMERRQKLGVFQNEGFLENYKEDEVAFVEKVNVISPSDNQTEKIYKTGVTSQRASITLRCVRNPTIGDKFASRHGQKGVLSVLWPAEDMPFTESGMVPDILFNPHGFPSRMTIGMLIESMAGKVAAIQGTPQDATPFQNYPRQDKTGIRWIDQGGYDGWKKRDNRYMMESEEVLYTHDEAVDYFGKALANAGYQYYGKEPLYSGTFGKEMEAYIFLGCVYYQRLRHMVSDKFQVRATGPIDALTQQPVKGRKFHGGIRFGEMERDALLAHGASALLQDRLMHSSDEHKAFACPSCGSILSPSLEGLKGRNIGGKQHIPLCRVCGVPCRLIAIPFVLRYICNELAVMNICLRLHLSQAERPLKTGNTRLPPTSFNEVIKDSVPIEMAL